MLLLLLVELVDERGDEVAIVVAKKLVEFCLRGKQKQNASKARNRRRGYIFARFRWEIP